MYQRRFIWLCLVLCGLLTCIARADDFKLNDGSSISGDVVSGDESGLRFRLPDETYSKPVPWTNFSQEDLKKLAEDPKYQRFKLGQFASIYIEETQEEKRQKTDVGQIKEPPRLKRPDTSSFFGSMVSSQVGFFVLVVLYAAGIYAAYEVALFRRRPKGLVCGLAAIPGFGLLSPIIFISLPEQRLTTGEETYEAVAAPTAAPASPTFTVPGMPSPSTPPAAAGQAGEHVEHTSEHEEAAEPDTHGLRLAQAPAAPSKPALPQPQIFQRGAFMFNRRFFETKFPNFFGVVRPEADKNMILFFKAARGEYVVERISRISTNDLHAQVRTAHATEEVMIPFTEIKEVHLKHKDSP